MGQKDFVIYTDIVSSSRYEANQIKELNDTLYGINKRTFCPPPIVFLPISPIILQCDS